MDVIGDIQELKKHSAARVNVGQSGHESRNGAKAIFRDSKGSSLNGVSFEMAAGQGGFKRCKEALD